mmetsp:Transcript_22076/g.40494  ORF Transcript_22076/g.40494 Transcript_22076/m.40494 type:complete len:83 (+) Transcript_22076:91-339(+)
MNQARPLMHRQPSAKPTNEPTTSDERFKQCSYHMGNIWQSHNTTLTSDKRVKQCCYCIGNLWQRRQMKLESFILSSNTLAND